MRRIHYDAGNALAACGRNAPRRSWVGLSTTTFDVDCSGCERTRAFKAAVAARHRHLAERAQRAPGTATLYVWTGDAGGTSVAWDYPRSAASKDMSFFCFGRWGQGWRPFGMADPDAWIAGAKAAAEARGYTVTVIRGPWPGQA